jgi:hypothetical protein
VARTDRITQARQEICYWIGKTHRFSFIPRSLCSAENLRECLGPLGSLPSGQNCYAPKASVPDAASVTSWT